MCSKWRMHNSLLLSYSAAVPCYVLVTFKDPVSLALRLFIVSSKKISLFIDCLFQFEQIRGSMAATDGHLAVNDQIISVNGEDTRLSNSEVVGALLKVSFIDLRKPPRTNSRAIGRHSRSYLYFKFSKLPSYCYVKPKRLVYCFQV